MAIKARASIDPKSFLATVGEGRSIGKYRKKYFVFSQDEAADAVFHIHKGKVEITGGIEVHSWLLNVILQRPGPVGSELVRHFPKQGLRPVRTFE